MRGRSTTFGAISIVNAIAGGRGAAAGVRLTTDAEVELVDKPGRWTVVINGKEQESRLAVETARLALKGDGKDPDQFSGRIETSSGTPIGVGLKTSSSSSTAVALAVHAALGHKAYNPQTVLECSVEASLSSGASVTGALDDAAACLLGGLNMTDNLGRKMVRSKLFEKSLKVVIKVPRKASARPAMDLVFVKKFGKITDSFFRMCLDEEYWRAMVLNGLTYSSILKYDPFPALQAVEMGALGAGLSGTGPAVAAVFEPSRQKEMEALAEVWRGDGSSIITTETNNEHGRLSALA
jgi:shikimate kinase